MTLPWKDRYSPDLSELTLWLLLLLGHFSRVQLLCDPIDGSPPGSPAPGILQARTLEWVAISSSTLWLGRCSERKETGGEVDSGDSRELVRAARLRMSDIWAEAWNDRASRVGRKGGWRGPRQHSACSVLCPELSLPSAPPRSRPSTFQRRILNSALRKFLQLLLLTLCPHNVVYTSVTKKWKGRSIFWPPNVGQELYQIIYIYTHTYITVLKHTHIYNYAKVYIHSYTKVYICIYFIYTGLPL